jgi:SH3 domain protein
MRAFAFLVMLVWGGAGYAQTALVADGARVNLRSGKGENYRIIKVLPAKAEVEIVAMEQGYAKVKTAEGQTGWVLQRLLEVQEAGPEEPAADKASSPGTAEAAQQTAIQVLQNQLAASQAQLKLEQQRLERFSFLLPAIAIGCLLLGVGLGITILGAYYRRRLHGLRI